MDRQYYLDLAAAELRMPIGTHLVLHEQPDHAAIVLDGQRLGRVVEESARRFRTVSRALLPAHGMIDPANLVRRPCPGPPWWRCCER